MIPFKETIETNQELIDACKKGFDDYRANRITKNDFFMYFGFTHGEAIIRFYGKNANNQQKLFTGVGFAEGSKAYFSAGINAWKNLKNGIYTFPPILGFVSPITKTLNIPLQTIYYGAPGTGKSYKVNELTKGDDTVIRTTFHPDSDYASFVGCYKPIEKEETRTFVRWDPVGQKPILLTVENQTGISDLDKEKKITYQFTQQAFLKAYIQAWKKLCDKSSVTKPTSAIPVLLGTSGGSTSTTVITSGTKSWTITSMSDDEITIRPLSENEENEEQKKTIKKTQLKDFFNNSNIENDLTKGIIDKLKGTGSDSFDDAWDNLKKLVADANQNPVTNKFLPQYLVIEEINRGNCAQIFGDIFQLLDRNEAGFSTYPIVPDADITRELKKELESSFMLYDPATKNFIDKLFTDADGTPMTYEIDETGRRGGTLEAVLNGKVLVLPCNLNLLATMNTSDQSLFPMDSAFKRRWDWEYVPIRYEKGAEDTDSKDNFDTFQITIGDKHYLWTEFLEKVNDKIRNITESEDKQMGEYFIKKSIEEKDFINKVMFYLWSEVGKDNFNSTNNALFVLPDGLIKETKDGKEEDKKEFSFNELFKENATKLLQGFMKKLEVKSEEEKAAENAATPPSATTAPTAE